MPQSFVVGRPSADYPCSWGVAHTPSVWIRYSKNQRWLGQSSRIVIRAISTASQFAAECVDIIADTANTDDSGSSSIRVEECSNPSPYVGSKHLDNRK